jgi:hypothetical protein
VEGLHAWFGVVRWHVHSGLRRRLLDMAEEDERVRAELAASGELFRSYPPRMAEVHNRNGNELQVVIDQHGWPGRSLVGEDGAEAAWLILLHAIGNPALQRGALPILQDAIARGEAPPAHAAYLEDKIRFFERRPQRYGTQADWDENGQMTTWMLEDPHRVNEYRRSVGLNPLVESARQVDEVAHEPPPRDFQKRQAEMEAWARFVGWL